MKLTACYDRPGGLSYRELEDVVAKALGDAHSVSYETLRKYHTGDQPFGSIRIEVVKVLARVYNKTLRQLSPELADIDELRHFEWVAGESNPEPADLGLKTAFPSTVAQRKVNASQSAAAA